MDAKHSVEDVNESLDIMNQQALDLHKIHVGQHKKTKRKYQFLSVIRQVFSVAVAIGVGYQLCQSEPSWSFGFISTVLLLVLSFSVSCLQIIEAVKKYQELSRSHEIAANSYLMLHRLLDMPFQQPDQSNTIYNYNAIWHYVELVLAQLDLENADKENKTQ